jgi:glycosyltransferase involved in cell wall biosynthesis
LFIVENTVAPFDNRVWAEALAARGWNYEVTIISPRGKRAPRAFEKIDGIEIFRHPMPIEADSKFAFLFEYLNALFWELLLSIRVFIRKPFCIVHGANPPDHIFLIAILFKIFGTKYIFDHHDVSPESYLAKFGRKDILHKFLLLMERLTFKAADIVISTNHSYKEIAIHRGKRKDRDVVVVRNGPVSSKISSKAPNHELKDGFQYLVAYIGKIGTQERIDVLLEAARHIVYKKKMNTVKFIIIGYGPDLRKMERLSREMELTEHVGFTGFLPFGVASEILATADVCVDPEFKNSYTDKSTMIKIMDYMIFGKPIVQFDLKEGRVTAGDASIYVKDNDVRDFAEAIIDLLNNPEKREKMGAIGKQRLLERLTWDRQKGNLRKAYQYLENG